jgi:hypothetical protein
MVAVNGQTKMVIYEVTYSTKTASNEQLSYSDIVLVEAETHEELTAKVVDRIRKLGPPGDYYVDSFAGSPYEPRSKKRIAKKITKDYENLVSVINAPILRRNLGGLSR